MKRLCFFIVLASVIAYAGNPFTDVVCRDGICLAEQKQLVESRYAREISHLPSAYDLPKTRAPKIIQDIFIQAQHDAGIQDDDARFTPDIFFQEGMGGSGVTRSAYSPCNYEQFLSIDPVIYRNASYGAWRFTVLHEVAHILYDNAWFYETKDGRSPINCQREEYFADRQALSWLGCWRCAEQAKKNQLKAWLLPTCMLEPKKETESFTDYAMRMWFGEHEPDEPSLITLGRCRVTHVPIGGGYMENDEWDAFIAYWKANDTLCPYHRGHEQYAALHGHVLNGLDGKEIDLKEFAVPVLIQPEHAGYTAVPNRLLQNAACTQCAT